MKLREFIEIIENIGPKDRIKLMDEAMTKQLQFDQDSGQEAEKSPLPVAEHHNHKEAKTAIRRDIRTRRSDL